MSQKETRIEKFVRQSNGRWLLHEAVGLDKTLELPSLQITISLAEVFAKVQFAKTPIRPPIAR